MKTLSIFLLLVLMNPGFLPAETPSTDSPTALVKQVGTYEQLLVAVRETRSESRVRVEKIVEQERVREAWEIGRLIDTHVLQHRERADYAKQVLPRLAGDLGMSERELYYMLEFYRAYPILPSTAELSWPEYRELLSVNDPQKRQVLAGRTEKENWSRDRLRKKIKTVTGKEKTSGAMAVPETLSPSQPGKPYTYRVVLAKTGPYAGELAVDLGFSNYVQLAEIIENTNPFREGDVLEFSEEEGVILKNKEASPYTYKAWVCRVLDGDTIEAVVDLGFGITTIQTLRFRGIDAPEIVTRDGMEAKEFVEKMLKIPEGGGRMVDGKTSSCVLIKTAKSDKYDRYLVDVFVGDKYVNNLLLKQGLAVQVEE